jgi:hypothetical protein
VPLGTMVDELDGGIESRSQVAKEGRRVLVGRISGRRKWKLKVVRDILYPSMASYESQDDEWTVCRRSKDSLGISETDIHCDVSA